MYCEDKVELYDASSEFYIRLDSVGVSRSRVSDIHVHAL